MDICLYLRSCCFVVRLYRALVLYLMHLTQVVTFSIPFLFHIEIISYFPQHMFEHGWDMYITKLNIYLLSGGDTNVFKDRAVAR